MHHCHYPGCFHDRSVTNRPRKIRHLSIAIFLIAACAGIEIAVALTSNSLALLAESGHMLSDSLALVLALAAVWLVRLPPSAKANFGYRRVEVLAALANGLGLLAVAGWIVWEAIEALSSPHGEILTLPVIVTATIAFGIHSFNAWLLREDSATDLNLRAVFLHMLADATSSVGVILAALASAWLHWYWADGIISLGISVLIILGAIPLIKQSLDILLEKTPNHLDLAVITSYISALQDVEAVNDIKVWAIAPGQELMTVDLAVNLEAGTKRDRLLNQIQSSLQQEFGIAQIVVQMSAPNTLNFCLLPEVEHFTQRILTSSRGES